MRIVGAGGCFESRKYSLEDISLEKAWIFIKELTLRIEPMKITSVDESTNIIKGTDSKKNLYTVFTRLRENNELEIGMDVAPSTIRVYGFSNNAKPVDAFFEEIENFIYFCRTGKYCSDCGKKIPKEVKFCPECGALQP